MQRCKNCYPFFLIQIGIFILHLGPPEGHPEKRIEIQVIYFGGDSTKHQLLGLESKREKVMQLIKCFSPSSCALLVPRAYSCWESSESQCSYTTAISPCESTTFGVRSLAALVCYINGKETLPARAGSQAKSHVLRGVFLVVEQGKNTRARH